MGIKYKGVLINWVLVVAIALSGLAAAAIVIVNSSATKAISAQAERSLLVADMQHAVQVEAEEAASFVAHLPEMSSQPTQDMDNMDTAEEASVHTDDTSPTDLSEHPSVREASDVFTEAARTALGMASNPDDDQRIRAAIAAHDDFIASLEGLNSAAHGDGDAMSVYHGDTQPVEAELMNRVQELRLSSIADLEAAVDRAEWSQRMLGIVLPIATVGMLVAVIWLIRTRRARHQVKLLEHVIAEKERFIGTVSHELRTPLAAIVGFTELLASGDPGLSEAEHHEYLSLILAQGNEVSGIVDDLLVAARAEIGELALVKVPIDLSAQVRQVVEALDFPSEKPDVPESPTYGLGDPGRVRQIVRNLLTNAIRYGGPHIEFEIDTHDESAALRVIDDGDPIPPEDQARIFEPYSTVSDGRPVTGSIGLGLTVSLQLARLMGGDLRYERSGELNSFTLTIPIAHESGHSRRDQESATGAPADLPGRHVRTEDRAWEVSRA